MTTRISSRDFPWMEWEILWAEVFRRDPYFQEASSMRS